MESDEIIYCFRRGTGWVPQYKETLEFLEAFDKDVANMNPPPYTNEGIMLIQNQFTQRHLVEGDRLTITYTITLG